MRVSGSLFTFSEMSASVADGTFNLLDAPISSSNFIATVANASASLYIYPLDGPVNRCPSWDELKALPTASLEFRVVLTRDSNELRADVFGGTPNYNYFFTCNPVGPCSNYVISFPTQLNQTFFALTSFNATAYSGTTYYFVCTVSDNDGNAVQSNTVSINPCLVPETMILMKTGEQKLLKNIKKGDQLHDSIVTSVQYHWVDQIYSINSGLLKASIGHIHILADGTLIQSDSLRTGHYLIDKDNNPIEITSVEVLQGEFEVINIATDTATYIANNIRTHNKFACPG